MQLGKERASGFVEDMETAQTADPDMIAVWIDAIPPAAHPAPGPELEQAAAG